MLLAEEKHRFETTGSLEEAEFTILSTYKAFRAQIDSLYSDSIGSIVREIAANAHDAQIEGGFMGAFYVHGPSELRPEFFIRDYGIGMGHEKVMQNYTRLYDSDKSTTNDLTGAWGLGSKSPFAYSDSFYLSCYDGSQVRHYLAAISENGKPKLAHMATEPCGEPRGVRVGFSVEPKDFGAFSAAVAKVALAYDQPFESNVPLSQKLGEVTLSGPGWRRLKNSNLPAKYNVRQGCIIYPVKASQELTLPGDAQAILLDCPIGTVRMTTSREEIDYNPATVAYLKARIEAMTAEAGELVWDAIKDIPTPVAFFDTLAKIKPGFDATAYVHPPTKLTSTVLATSGIFYTATYSNGKSRWEYGENAGIDLRKAPKNLLILRDIGIVRDTPEEKAEDIRLSGTKPAGFSVREVRRLNRLIRNFCDQHHLVQMTFGLEIDYSDAFWDACLPEANRTETTVEKLRETKRPKITRERSTLDGFTARGVSMWRAGKLSPAEPKDFEFTDVSPKQVAWMEAALYRRCASDITALMKKAGLTQLFIPAAHARGVVVDRGILHFRDSLLRDLPKDFTIHHFSTALGMLQGRYSERPAWIAVLLAWRTSGEPYERMVALPGEFGQMLRTARIWIDAGYAEWTSAQRDFIDILCEGQQPGGAAPKAFKALQRFCDDVKESRKGYAREPLMRFFGTFITYQDAADAERALNALYAVQRAAPMKIKP